jgi:diguanylate cyclase (GGDEF)-like protein
MRRSDKFRRTVLAGYLLLAALVIGYLASILLRPSGEEIPMLDKGLVTVMELGASVLCLANALTRGAHRGVSVALGSGLLLWSVGGVIWRVLAGSGVAPAPSLADPFFLAFYPLTYLGLVVLIRSDKELLPSAWLDGLLCGLGAGSATAAFAFERIAHGVQGSTLSVATNLAYPLGDLVLLSIAVGALALLPHRWHPHWLLLIAGCAAIACADTVYLLQYAAGVYRVGSLADAGWPISFLMLSAAVWIRPQGGRPTRFNGEALLAGPGIAALIGTGVLVYGTHRHLGLVAVVLATATLVTTAVRILLSVRDLRSLAESRRIAVTDDLTGLGNRRMFDQELSRMLGEPGDPSPDPLAVLLIDVDRFNEINSSFGRPVGDALLRQFADRLQSVVRGADLLVRLGGDEFALVLKGADTDAATELAQRLGATVADPFSLAEMSLDLRTSIGIARYPQDAEDVDGLLRCADVARYRARAAGYTFAVYDRSRDDSRERFLLYADLRHAVERRELTVCYQPQLELDTGKIISVEALLRWQRQDGVMVPPDRFIPLAEETGLMPGITAFVLDTALDQCARWRQEGLSLSVAVNVSANDLLDPSLLDTVGGLLARYGLPPQALILEITEGVLLTDITGARQAVQRLQDFGITVSIDDFGTGFSSLAYLRDLAVTELKIDRSFITDLATTAGQRGRDIVRSTINLAHALRLRVVAEGIEDPETLAMLAQLGCDLAQGYHISRPQPPHALPVLVRSLPHAPAGHS